MALTSETLIGHIVDVRGDGLTANLVADDQVSAPVVTVGSEDVLVGQIGSYVAVQQGAIKILCLVCRITEQEKLADADKTVPEAPALTFAQRTIFTVPIGTVMTDGEFEPEQPASLRLHRHFLHLIPGHDEAQHDL